MKGSLQKATEQLKTQELPETKTVRLTCLPRLLHPLFLEGSVCYFPTPRAFPPAETLTFSQETTWGDRGSSRCLASLTKDWTEGHRKTFLQPGQGPQSLFDCLIFKSIPPEPRWEREIRIHIIPSFPSPDPLVMDPFFLELLFPLVSLVLHRKNVAGLSTCFSSLLGYLWEWL